MKPDLPSPDPRAELEAKVTALLLGELSAAEAANVMELIAHDAELAKLRDQLMLTLDLLRETAATPVGQTPAQPEPLRLSKGKREKLLANFKTIRPKEFEKKPRRQVRPLLMLAAVLLICGVLAGLMLPALSSAKRRAAYISPAQIARMRSDEIRLRDEQFAAENSQNIAGGASVDKSTGDRLIQNRSSQPMYDQRQIVLPQNQPAGDTTFAAQNEDVSKLQRKVETGLPSIPSNGNRNYVVSSEFNATANFSRINDGSFQARAQADALKQNKSLGVPTTSPVAASAPPAASPAPALALEPAPQPAPVFAGTPAPAVEPPAAAPPASTPNQDGSLGTLINKRSRGLGGGSAQALSSAANPSGRFPGTEAEAFAESEAGRPAPASSDLFDKGAHRITAKERPADATASARPAELAWGKNPTPITYASPADVSGALDKLATTASPVAGEKKTNPFVGRYEFRVTGQKQQTNLDLYAVQTSGYANEGNINGNPTAGFGLTVPRSNYNSTNAVVTFATGGGDYSTNSPMAVGGSFSRIDGKKDNESIDKTDAPLRRAAVPILKQQPEILTRENAFTTFSLNVSDVGFHLAEASLKDGRMPDAASMRSEEFINAFDYRDPEPPPGAPIGFAWERAGDPFAHNRDFLRFSIQAAATGREAGRPLNLVLLVDKSGSMERADRVAIIAEALKVLASQLRPDDTLSVVVFARTAHLIVDGVSASEAAAVFEKLRAMTPQGGTNLEEAMRLAYLAAFRHYLPRGENRVVLLTDGAANLGNVDPKALKQNVERNRKQGVALDCFGVGLDGYNDEMLETLSRAGNGRYAFLNTPEEAGMEFAGKLAGALRVAAADVKVQVEFNPKRVSAYRQIGYAKDQLQTQDFRDNSVRAGQIGAAESGNALYTIEVNPTGEGDIGTVRVRFHAPGSDDVQERAWPLPYTGTSAPLDKASPAMRLCATAASFAEWLAGSPYAGEVTPDKLLNYLNGVPQVYGADTRPGQLQWMIRQAKSISGK